MSIFEFISVMVSIVLGLSFAQLLLTVSRFARNSSRVKAYLPHTIWLANLVLWHFLMWWSFWDYRNVEWNYGRFLVITLEPLLLFLTTSIAAPKKFDTELIDNQENFFEVRHWFFLSFIALQVLSMVDGQLVFGSEPLWVVYRIPQLVVLTVMVLGFLMPRHWAQQLSAWTVFLALLLASYFRFLPAAFE